MSPANVARDAFDAFHAADYKKCIQLLESIQSNKSSAYDVKTAHNASLANYYKSGCSEPQQLFQQLTAAHEKRRETEKKDKKKQKKDDDDEDTSYREGDDFNILKYNQALLCMQLRHYGQATVILEDLFSNIEPIDDYLAIKICFLLLELRLIEREPELALPVLAYMEKNNVFLTVLPRERSTKTDLPLGDDGGDGEEGRSKADGEEGGNESSADASSAAPPAAVAFASKAQEAEVFEGPLPSLSLGAFLPRHGRAPDRISPHEFRFYVLMYRARVAAALRNYKAAKKDLKAVVELLENDLKKAPLLTPHQHTTGAAGSAKSSAAETALRDALYNQHHAMVWALKAQLECARQNVGKSTKLLAMCQFNFAQSTGTVEKGTKKKAVNEDDGETVAVSDFHPSQDDACAGLFYNNLGCIHFMMQKPSLATYYFNMALESEKRLVAMANTRQPAQSSLLGAKLGLVKPGVLATRHWLDRRAEMWYNAGLQMLLTEKPQSALQCFENCIPIFRTWPRLWMRLAECCIEVHRQATAAGCSGATGWNREARCSMRSSGIDASSGEAKLCWGVQGVGKLRRWCLTTAKPPLLHRGVEGEDGSAYSSASASNSKASGTSEKHGLSTEHALDYAFVYLRNCLACAASASSASTASGASEGDTDKNGSPADTTAPAAAAAAASGRSVKAAEPPAAAKHHSGAVHMTPKLQAREAQEAEASLLEDTALLKLAYVALAQNQPQLALSYGRRLMRKHALLPPRSDDEDDPKKVWSFQTPAFLQTMEITGSSAASASNAGAQPPSKFSPSVGTVALCVMYTTEALLLLGKLGEAKALLGSFVRNDVAAKGADAQLKALLELEKSLSVHVVGGPKAPDPFATVSEEMRKACGGHNPSTAIGGLTAASHVLYAAGGPSSLQLAKEPGKEAKEEKACKGGKESGHAAVVAYPSTTLCQLGDMQSMLLCNLAALQCTDGNAKELKEAEKRCEQALLAQPQALAPLRMLIYILLRKGDHAKALERLRRSRLYGKS
eukprot:TRINITY_DN91171_c0_g1_i1.p1 TRINITY_DN91171_c0_g1~~TRINITY_DN91171_c0_g1_i1.p1  ORF type:complete len:1053 (+),score=262.09 TRINITY_DN91171_c0_g1_i1:112-3159(+)